MSVNVHDFNDKSGTVTMVQRGKKFVLPIYAEGKTNCFLTCLWESNPNDKGIRTYELMWFLNDEAHAKRMLGLAKSYNGEKENYLSEITGLTVYKGNCSNWKKIVALFAQAFDEIDIKILKEAPKDA